MGVSVRQKDGNWFVFVRHRGQRVAQKCFDQEHAETVQKLIFEEIRGGRFDIAAMQRKRESEPGSDQAPAPTLKAFFEKTMTPYWEATLAAKTFARYDGSFRLYILPVLGERPVNTITRDDVKKFVVSLLTREIGTKEKPRRLSKESIRNIVAALRSALTEAVEKNLLPANPAVRLGKLYREAQTLREEVDPFTVEEIPALLETTRTRFGYENYVLMLTAFHTGLRAAELAGLHWDDLDVRRKALRIQRQYRDHRISKTKGKRSRTVDVSDVLLTELQALKKRRKQEYLARGKAEVPEWVFLSPGLRLPKERVEGQPLSEAVEKAMLRAEGQPWDMDNWRNRVFWKACEAAKIRRRRLHDTRHTFASILLMAGESPQYVKEQMGHSSIKITVDVYGHFIPGTNRQAVTPRSPPEPRRKLPQRTSLEWQPVATSPL